jgi:lysophospholipase L1-like esterase
VTAAEQVVHETGLAPLPLRVLVKGASPAHWISWMDGPREDLAYPRITEQELLAAGHPARVRDLSVTSERARTGLKNWQRQVFNFSPDVVVLNYGLFEAVHQFLPQPLERYANSLISRPGSVRDAYRKRVVRPTWVALAKGQQRLDGVLPATMFRHRPRRFAADMELLIQRIQMVQSPLVLVLEVSPPGETWRSWFPGIAERISETNEVLAEVVRRIDRPDVRYFPTSTALAGLVDAGEDIVPDGGHYTPAAHRALGAALAAEILAWSEQQPLLRRR